MENNLTHPEEPCRNSGIVQKGQRTGALQDPAELRRAAEARGSYLECGSPLLLGNSGRPRNSIPSPIRRFTRQYRYIGLLFAASLLLLLPHQLAGQTFKTLYSFSALDFKTHINGDGFFPWQSMVSSNNTLYGMTEMGGSGSRGTVFAINTDGSGFTTLHSFSGPDGFKPNAKLVLSDNTLYGTTENGGDGSRGTVFASSTDGTTFQTLYSFSSTEYALEPNSDGIYPDGVVLESGNMLYGMTSSGGSAGLGTIFSLNLDGSAFTTLYSFTSGTGGYYGFAPLILSDGVLYGAIPAAGTFGHVRDGGEIFAIRTDGTGFAVLHTFSTPPSNSSTNSDGFHPVSLLLSGTTLMGITDGGGSFGHGAVFKLNSDGSGFSTLHNFADGSDGAEPSGDLTLQGDTLYGLTTAGGSDVGSKGHGTIFSVNSNGTAFTTLHTFTSAEAGASSATGLMLLGSTFYGTTGVGGAAGSGSIFSFSLPVPRPQLRIASGAGDVSLSWPTNATGFILQSTTNLGAASSWTSVATPPLVVNGQNTVTNSISGTLQFFRLSQ